MEEKPIQLKIEDTKKEIMDSVTNICNTNQVDYYFLKTILKELYNEVEEKSYDEINILRNNYQKEIKNDEESNEI